MPRPLIPPKPGHENEIRTIQVNARCTYGGWTRFKRVCAAEGYPVTVAVGKIAELTLREPARVAELLRTRKTK
ncbi:MAG: hypothetical protein ACREB9_07570 [Thermoplasmata archaeon]